MTRARAENRVPEIRLVVTRVGTSVLPTSKPSPSPMLLELFGALLIGFATATAFRVFRATPGEIAGTVVGIGLLVLAFTNPLGRWVTVFALSADDRWAHTAALWLALLLVAAVIIAWATRDPLDT